MRQRAAAQPPQPQNDQLPAGHAPMRAFEFGHRGTLSDGQRRLCSARKRGGDRQRIVRGGDRLHPERETQFAGHAADAVEPRLVIVALLASHPRGDFSHTARQVERALADQDIEQFGPPPQFVGERGREHEDAHQLVEQRGALEQQIEQVQRGRRGGEHPLPTVDRLVGLGRRGEPFEQRRQQCVERGARRLGAERADAPVGPSPDALREAVRIAEAELAQPHREAVAHRGDRVDLRGVVGDQGIVPRGHRAADLRQLGNERRAIRQPVEPRDRVERRPGGQGMGLLVLDHLQAVLDHPQPVIGLAQHARVVGRDDPRRRQRIERGARAAHPQRGIAPAVDQLVRLGEEFDLADAPAPQLDVEPRPRFARTRVARADPRGQPADLADRPEIEAAAPHERADLAEEPLARGDIARCRARADERRALPRQRTRFRSASARASSGIASGLTSLAGRSRRSTRKTYPSAVTSLSSRTVSRA